MNTNPASSPLESVNSKLVLGAKEPAGEGAEAASAPAARPKVPQQTIVLLVVLTVSAGAITAMRMVGTRAGIAMGGEAVEYTPPEPDAARNYERIMGDLARIRDPLDVALGEFGKSPFMLQQTAVTPDPVAAPQMSAEQRAQAEAAARQEARRRQLADELATLKVQSVMGGKVALARIGGEVYRQGDVVAGLFTVAGIHDRSVVLEADGQQFTLTLDVPQAGKTPPARMGGAKPANAKPAPARGGKP
jgi:hypothetical protein